MANEGVSAQVFELRPLNIADLLDQVIRIYRGRFGELIGIAAAVVIPLGVVNTVLSYSFTLQPEPGMSADIMPNVLMSGAGTAVAVLFYWLTMPLMEAATAKAVSEYYLHGGISFRAAYRFALGRWATLLWVAVLGGLAVGTLVGAVMTAVWGAVAGAMAMPGGGSGGTGLLLIVGGTLTGLAGLLLVAVVAVRLFFGGLAVILERRAAMDGLSRSWNLTQGHVWRVAGVLLVVGLMVYIGQVILVMPAMIGFAFLANAGLEAAGMVVMQAISSLAALLTTPFYIIATVLLYYDLRIRKEGFDLAMMAAAIGEPERIPRAPSGEAREPLFGAPAPEAAEALPPPPPAAPETDEAAALEPPPTGAARDRPPLGGGAPTPSRSASEAPSPPPVPDIPEEPENEP